MQNEMLNDDVLLDRLVDGELAGIERRQLLESLDKRPEGWRRCALAFLEAQSWREELGQVARGLGSVTKEHKSPASFVPSSMSSRWSTGAKWLALAASLMLAFELGWRQHERGVPVAGEPSHVNNQVASVPPPGTSAAPHGAKASNALTFYVRDEAGKMQPVRVPLVDAGTLDDQFGVKFQPGMPDEMRDQLQDRGYNVQSKRQYAPLWLEKENGRPMLVPVEDTKIVPVSEKVF